MQENEQVRQPEKVGAEQKKAEPEKKPEAEKKLTKAEEAKKDLLAKSEISIILDTYDDIFSDFDPRPYPVRGLSEDFLQAARKAVTERGKGALELRLMIPKALRGHESENLIKKRLHEHFKKHAGLISAEIKKTRHGGALLAIVGFAILLVAAYIVTLEGDGLFYSLLLVILEPSGWFTVWSGLETVFFRVHEKDAEMDFYRRMSKAEVVFAEY